MKDFYLGCHNFVLWIDMLWNTSGCYPKTVINTPRDVKLKTQRDSRAIPYLSVTAFVLSEHVCYTWEARFWANLHQKRRHKVRISSARVRGTLTTFSSKVNMVSPSHQRWLKAVYYPLCVIKKSYWQHCGMLTWKHVVTLLSRSNDGLLFCYQLVSANDTNNNNSSNNVLVYLSFPDLKYYQLKCVTKWVRGDFSPVVLPTRQGISQTNLVSVTLTSGFWVSGFAAQLALKQHIKWSFN